MKEIKYIEISKIYPHPDNPRKELGDLTELADSIRENGIFQNLTVIPGHFISKEEFIKMAKAEGMTKTVAENSYNAKDWYQADGYTVIIGHRRLSAAKLAGLETVPCIVTEMDEKTQLSTMLLENMQRSDLTVYEQAQGFQMMIDLGSNVAELSQKTGFSATTIRHRINLLDLDADKFKKSESRGARITDYIELEKIKNIKLKNQVLQFIGTNNFHIELKKALDKERLNEIRQEWFDVFGAIAEKLVDSQEHYKRNRILSFWINNKITPENKARIEKAVAENTDKNLYWHFDGFSYIYLLGDFYKTTSNNEEPPWKKAERIREKRNALIAPFEDAAWECRKKFVKEYSGTKKDLALLLQKLFSQLNDWHDSDESDIAELLDISLEYDDENEDFELLSDNEKFLSLIESHPQKVVLAYLFEQYDDIENRRCSNFYNSTGHNFSGLAKKMYAILEHCGYELSDDEFKLIGGTHPVFKEMEGITE